MAKKINQLKYDLTSILKGTTINRYGRIFAFEENADGFSYVDNETQPLPSDLKTYLAGSTTITTYAFPSNIDKLGKMVLISFPNVNEVYLFKNDEIVELDENTFDGLNSLESIYVPSNLLLQYQSTYADYDYVDKFKELTTEYVITIPFISNTTLTKAFVDDYLAMLSSGQKAAASKVIIDSNYEFIDDEALSGLNVLPNCDTLSISQDHLGMNVLKGVSTIHYIESTNANLVLDDVLDSTGTLQAKWLVPLDLLYTYIFKQYVNDLYITGYVDKMEGNSMPDRIENGYWQWFSDKQTREEDYLGDTETYPTATYSGRYYAFIVIDTLFISGTGRLTAEIVQNAINSIDTDISPLENITKVFVSGFTSYGEGCFNPISSFPNKIILKTNCKFVDYTDRWLYSEYFYADVNTENSKIKAIENNSSSVNETNVFFNFKNIEYFLFRSATSFTPSSIFNNGTSAVNKTKVYLPIITSFIKNGYYTFGGSKQIYYVFIGTNNCPIGSNHPSPLNNLKQLYVPASNIVYYKTTGAYARYSNIVIGILDGNNVYTDKGFTYPKLTETLTLNTSNGHLMENETDLFDGYTATWYSDEDCTQVISDLTTITSTTTAYVKLTAIAYNQKIGNNLTNLNTNVGTSPSTNLVASYISIINPITVGHKVYAKVITDDPRIRVCWFKTLTSAYDFATGTLMDTNSSVPSATEGIYEITSDMIYTDGYLQLYWFVGAGLPTGQYNVKIQLIDLTALGMDNIINVPLFKATDLGKWVDSGAILEYKA